MHRRGLMASTQPRRPIYNYLYGMMKEATAQNDPNKPEDGEEQLNIKESRDKFVQEQLREMLFSMKETSVPKGVWMSQAMMSLPLLSLTAYLCMLTPMAANPAIVDPVTFAYVARSSLRLLSLNVAFFGGIHYGLGSAFYDTVYTEEDLKATRYQIAYSFVPAAMSVTSSMMILGATPL